MKLIHLPTGVECEREESIAKYLLGRPEPEYIRAELPEYFRVEGYDKSWEWFENNLGRNPHGKEYDWVSNRLIDGIGVNAWESDCKYMMDTPLISRAEFEYHKYNPWKKVQEGMAQLERGIENSRLNDPKEQLDMSDVDKLREAAEKMGFELVRKHDEWEAGENIYYLDKIGMKVTHALGACVWINTPELETLIEKYNQLKTK